jgi:hypothetical protein
MRYTRLPAILCVACGTLSGQALPGNHWVELARDPVGARPGSAIRYAPDAGRFFLWGYMNADPNLPQEQPLMEAPEYDVVTFDLESRHWLNALPSGMDRAWSRRLPLAYIPRTYSGITTGSERSVMRGASDDAGATPRPDLNIVFDQVAYCTSNRSLFYFTGGLTATYHVARRRWTDLRPTHSPPPVLGGSLAYDPLNDQLILFGGGHVAERAADGSVHGYTGTWAYRIRENDWRELPLRVQPSPRMQTRMVCDTRRQALVLFGGDSQTHYLGDTWIFDLKTQAWRQSAAPGPAPRAGHFTVYDPESGLVIIGGGYNRQDLTDMWAYDAAADRWFRIASEVPTGFYLTADLAPERRLFLLVTSGRAPGDRRSCNILFPVRTTYAFHIAPDGMRRDAEARERQESMPKRQPEPARDMSAPAAELGTLPPNQWVLLRDVGRAAPARTWGSATFDDRRERILYWGGGHCGYEGSDVDMYDVEHHTWIADTDPPSYPERQWNHGVRLAGVTFNAEPWTDHGRRIYAYDPIAGRLVMVHPIRLTTGYEPAWLRDYPSKTNVAPDALVSQPSSYVKYATWSYNLNTRRWTIAGPAPAGVDTLVSTPLGVMGVNVNWPGRLTDAGYQLPWTPTHAEDNAIFLLHGAQWERLSTHGSAPQNLYEMTSLAWDSKRKQVILHGAGARRDELWTFDPATKQWTNRKPTVEGGEDPPACTREAVYIPAQDTFLIYGAGTWGYNPARNMWRRTAIAEPAERAGQNRAMVYDAKRDVVLLVLGASGNEGRASVYALRYSGQGSAK